MGKTKREVHVVSRLRSATALKPTNFHGTSQKPGSIATVALGIRTGLAKGDQTSLNKSEILEYTQRTPCPIWVEGITSGPAAGRRVGNSGRNPNISQVKEEAERVPSELNQGLRSE